MVNPESTIANSAPAPSSTTGIDTSPAIPVNGEEENSNDRGKAKTATVEDEDEDQDEDKNDGT